MALEVQDNAVIRHKSYQYAKVVLVGYVHTADLTDPRLVCKCDGRQGSLYAQAFYILSGAPA